MKISHFADRIRTLSVAIGLALVASMGASHAYAADPAPAAAFKIDPAKQAKAMADAPAIVATAKIACEPVNAYILGGTEYEKPDKTKVKGSLYEIACQAGPGFMITVVSNTEVYQPFTCSLAAKIHKTRTDSILCVLPENNPHFKWLNPVVQPFLAGCVVSDSRIIGSTTAEPLIDRYEVGCGTQMGGIIDYPQLGAKGQAEFKSCLIEEGTTSACQFTTKDQILVVLKPLAAKADPKCQINNVRFVGITKESDGYFYEFGCSNQAGFMVLAKLDSSTFVRIVPCASAAGLGGCKFTDQGAIAADANSTFTDVLKKAGFTCTVKDYNVVGTQESTKRDYVEFKCPEQPWGLIGFVPQIGSPSSVNVTDCFLDQVRHKSCTLTTAAQLKAQLDKLIKIAEPTKGCDVSDVRYIGESQGVDKGLIAELACANKRGYIVVVAGDRNSLVSTIPCKIAKAHKEEQQCEIAGNGTYAGGND